MSDLVSGKTPKAPKKVRVVNGRAVDQEGNPVSETRKPLKYGSNVVDGRRVQLTGKMTDDPDPIDVGSMGTIQYVDDGGTLHVKWDNGRSLGLVPTDEFEVIDIHVGGQIKRVRDQRIFEVAEMDDRTFTAYSVAVKPEDVVKWGGSRAQLILNTTYEVIS